MSDPWAADNLAAIPELAIIQRAGWLSKARIFALWCKTGEHRCVQVLTIDGRPLALGKQATLYRTAGGMKHRGWMRGVWLDVAPAHIPVPAECRCSNKEYIPAGWLAEQIAAKQKRRVLDAATLAEISRRAASYAPL
jgi:hypothetical protein